MHLKILRNPRWSSDTNTIGFLYVNNEPFCYTIEDVARPHGIKIPGKTAIPEGLYKIIIDLSTRFKKLMPHILDVKDFVGVRIHSANTDKDVEGCIGVGYKRNGTEGIYESKQAFEDLFKMMEEAEKKHELITLEITTQPKIA